MPAWPDMLTMMAWLSQRYRFRYGVGVTNSNDLARITNAGTMLVDFLTLRRHKPLRDGAIPLLVSGVYKVCLGYLLPYLPERFSDENMPAELPDAAGFLEYLEESGLLIGEAEVCSCPPAMILQSYEAILGEQIVSGESLPEPCAGLGIDWDAFDVFAHHAGEMYRDLVMFALRMPAFLPDLDDTSLSPDARQRLSAALTRHGERLLEAQQGMVVELARSVQAAMGPPAPAPPRRTTEPSPLAATVTEWLRDVEPAEMELHAPAVAAALESRLGAYEEFEADLLTNLNRDLNAAMRALGFETGAPLTRVALTGLCGRTLGDWT